MRTFTLAALGLALTATAAAADVGVSNAVQRPLAAFAADQNADCSSPYLKMAATYAIDREQADSVSSWVKPADLGRSVSDLLDVADVAFRRDCSAYSESVYRYVLRKYVGVGSDLLRDRAELGLLRLGRRPKP